MMINLIFRYDGKESELNLTIPTNNPFDLSHQGHKMLSFPI